MSWRYNIFKFHQSCGNFLDSSKTSHHPKTLKYFLYLSNQRNICNWRNLLLITAFSTKSSLSKIHGSSQVLLCCIRVCIRCKSQTSTVKDSGLYSLCK